MNLAQSIAEILLKLEAVSLSTKPPFTWASGLKAPIYCDNRLIISTVEERKQVIDGFVTLLGDHKLAPDLVAGTATAGIPHAAWLADRLDVPMVYVRSSEKAHGKKNLIEGRIQPGAKAIVVEDLISTGGSSIRAAQALTQAGAEVLAVVAIFSYQLSHSEALFRESGIPFYTLSHLEALLEVAQQAQALSPEESASINQWRQNPKAWSETMA